MNSSKVQRGWLRERWLPIAVFGGAFIVVAVGLVLSTTAAPPRSAAEREAAATELLSGMQISIQTRDTTLLASKALVDYLSEPSGRLVLVRIVDEVDLEVRIEAEQEIVFSEPPSFCLVGPDSAPDDGGYTSPCFGTPDLGQALADQLPTDDAGHVMVPAGDPIVLSATIGRGGLRCDYPPGGWMLVVEADPLVDAIPTGSRALPEISFEIPWQETGPLPFFPVRKLAYCGLANAVYREQGEPEVASPSP